MTIPLVTDLSGVDQDVYTQAEIYIRELLQEQFPDRNLGVGRAFYWQQVVPNALLAAAHVENVKNILDSTYLANLRANPELATDELVDLTLANYFVSRRTGSNASGTVAVIATVKKNYTIQAGTLITNGTHSFEVPETLYVYTSEGQVVNANDRFLKPREDGRYQFTAPVIAVEEGPASFTRAGTLMSLESAVSGIETVVAVSDISGGVSTETTKDLISRIPTSLAAQVFAAENQTAALIDSEFPGTLVSMTGMDDPEMHRDKVNLTGISSGGMVDIWCATSASAAIDTVQATATLVNASSRIWEAQVPSSVLRSAYGVVAVRNADASADTPSYDLVTQIRGFSIPEGLTRKPRIFTGMDAAFSQYQTIRVQFVDTTKPAGNYPLGSTAEYDLEVLGMPLIDEIADFMQSPGRLDRATDVLVRGAVPCLVDIDMTVRLLDGDFAEDLDVGQIKAAIVDAVASIGFDYGVLSTSRIQDAVHDYLTGRSDVSSTRTTLTGTVLAPSGDILSLNSEQELKIPDLPERQVTKRTAVFVTDASRITITFTRVEAD